MTVDDHGLDIATWGHAPSTVFVHDGLGSIGQWRDVPQRVAAISGRGTLAYDRAGHGRSTPVPRGPWPIDWMAHEAEVLADVIARHAVSPARLVGHSDGGTIALLCAAKRPDLVSDVVALAAHSWVETKCVNAIAALRSEPDTIVPALSRYHRHPAELFEAWSGAWTSAPFASWDVRPQLAAITCPAIVVQGADDEYATEQMAWTTARAIGSPAEVVIVSGCRHAIHRDAPDLVVQLAVGSRCADT